MLSFAYVYVNTFVAYTVVDANCLYACRVPAPPLRRKEEEKEAGQEEEEDQIINNIIIKKKKGDEGK